MTGAFHIYNSWLPTKGASEIDVTLSQLKLTVAGKNVCEFIEDDGEITDHLEIPVYFLAEWIAENWWPLLWEPRKSEDGADDVEFLARHSILAAQHGFALPNVSFVPTGRTVHVSAKARDASYADVRFRRSAYSSPSREAVADEMRTFVKAVCAKLAQAHIANTGLQLAWQLVEDVTEEEVLFCQFAGALGLAPHDASDRTANLLEQLLEKLGERLLMDLCLVAPANHFDAVAKAALSALEGLSKTKVATLEPLLEVPPPPDDFSVDAWHRGVRAARQLRTRFGIEDTDAKGAGRVFELLGIDTDRHGNEVIEGGSLTGAVARNDKEARISLLQPIAVQRRFAAARGIFTAWTAGQQERRFLTSAVTRDQQANRAFAAELTAPYALLRSRARQSKLTQDQVFDLAAELQIGGDVVSKQALNNGLQVTPT